MNIQRISYTSELQCKRARVLSKANLPGLDVTDCVVEAVCALCDLRFGTR